MRYYPNIIWPLSMCNGYFACNNSLALTCWQNVSAKSSDNCRQLTPQCWRHSGSGPTEMRTPECQWLVSWSPLLTLTWNTRVSKHVVCIFVSSSCLVSFWQPASLFNGSSTASSLVWWALIHIHTLIFVSRMFVDSSFVSGRSWCCDSSGWRAQNIGTNTCPWYTFCITVNQYYRMNSKHSMMTILHDSVIN